MPKADEVTRSLLISGGTVIDGLGGGPLEDHSIWIEGRRVRQIGPRVQASVPDPGKVLDARGKYVIPGLMNANVHLLCDIRLENLARYWGRYDDLIAEAAQVALKNGLTTVFDTWGPRRHLMAVRDRIESGEIPGPRIFCAGNIVGLDGPFSDDFLERDLGSASAVMARRINGIWVENIGRHLMWLPPEAVADEVRTYIAKGIDFLKYNSNDHSVASKGAFLAFSPDVQAAIVAAAHDAGLTAQAHTMTVEGLRIAVQAGCDLIQHANHTGPVPIPQATIDLMIERKCWAVVFPMTQRRLDWLIANQTYKVPAAWKAADLNVRTFIRSGAPMLMANDGVILAPEALTDPMWAKSNWMSGEPKEDILFSLSSGHFAWLRAMEEKGLPALEILRAATRNVAEAYGKRDELGTIETGKVADMLILDKNPLESAENYRAIHAIVKDGAIVDRGALPVSPILTRAVESTADEEGTYIPFLGGAARFPVCPCG